MGPTVGTEAKTIIRENTLKDRRKNLGYSLLTIRSTTVGGSKPVTIFNGIDHFH